MANIATVKRVQAEELRGWLLDPQRAPQVAVVDVRDHDHVGGHIRGSIHEPSNSLDTRMPEVIRKMADKKTVVFHCSLSQQRGPSAALQYLREQEAKRERGGAAADTEQNVFVLDKGFAGWVDQGLGRDERVTEGFAPDIWGE